MVAGGSTDKLPHPLVVILGPTASGKSALALELARRCNAEILSVDSMQVYRGMDVGTAKPSSRERTDVPHHLLDVVDPCESFAVARFVEVADRVVADAASRGRGLIATGGTPLYYKALFDGLFDGPGADEEVRKRLGAQSNDDLALTLQRVDPLAAARIHTNDRKRLIRAIEVFELTGQPISSLQTDWAGPRVRHKALWFGLHWERDALNRRINARVRQMIAGGWPDEVRALLSRYRELSLTAGEATGYRELAAHVRGEVTLEDAVEQIKIATRQLARRQMKWFRRFPQVHWLPGDAPLEANVQQILETQ